MDFLKKLKDHFVPSHRNVYRPHVLRRPWLIFFLAVILTAQGVFIINIVARQSALTFVAAVMPGEVIALTNDERVQYSVGTLTENSELDAAAQAKADDMAAKGYFSHVGPDGTVPWAWIAAAGYQYQYAGENLAVRFTDSSDVVNAWMASPTHKENIVKPVYTEIGVGVAQGEFQGQPATYVVQYFGTPAAGVVAVQNNAPAAASSTGATVAAASLQGDRGRSAAATVAPPAAVEGTSTASAQTEVTSPAQPVQEQPQSPWSSIAKNILDTQSSPSQSVLWVLGAVASILVIGLALTFFVHIQVQPTDMLISGAVIAAVAISFMTLNFATPFSNATSTQSATVLGAMPQQGGFIDSVAANASR